MITLYYTPLHESYGQSTFYVDSFNFVINDLKMVKLKTSYQAVSSRNIPSRSKCIKSSPPLKYSKIKYSLPPV